MYIHHFCYNYKYSHFAIWETKAIQPQSDEYTIIDAVQVARNLPSLITNSEHFLIVLIVCQVLFVALESVNLFNLYSTPLR